ncbi:MAG TPA: M43 family zinc metalloprotease, partial [Cyclobacteriaceae bacterium]|nr:M43 family zinc metalloprotease [Cyclobacteriaceae bacterium]
MNAVNRMRIILFVAPILTSFNLLLAQEKCGTVEHTNQLMEKQLLREERDGFEEWLKDKTRIRELHTNAAEANKVYRIPVVVHIIHKGESIGVGSNLSDAQVLSQIKVLNTDYERLNADTLDTPSEFSGVAGKFNVEFVLAKQDPNGKSTNGIVRVKGSKNVWTINDDATLKGTSYWPAEDYLNIWVTDLSSTLLGYAQFPVSDLAGLEDAEDNRLTDGVVIDYTSFGSINDGSFNLDKSFNHGRTAVHEIGHFFGLRHIWGDDNGSCGGSGDYVSDTPNQSNYTDGCPSHPYTTCNAHSMFQNYMDYTDDVCMNLFTKEQVNRMLTVIQNSPRRKTLTSSIGLDDPAPVANDLGIQSVLSPSSAECGSTIIPTIEIINRGSNSITSASVKFSINNAEVETRSFALSLASGETTDVSFPEQSIDAGSSLFSFEIMKTNGATDGKVSD